MKTWMKLTSLIHISTFACTANSIELTDYTDPVSSFESAYITGQFNAKSGNQDQTSFDLTFIGDYDSSYSSLNRVFDLTVDGEIISSRGASSSDNTQRGYNLFAQSSVNNYLTANNPSSKVFWFGSLDVGGRRILGADSTDDPFIQIGAGLGYGRVINATPLALAIRIVEELNEYGLLRHQLPHNTFLDLAQIISRENEYRQKYGRDEYTEKWYQDIEKLLASQNLLTTGDLGAVGVIRINRVLKEEKVSIRKHGWLVRAGLGYIISNYDSSSSTDPSLDARFEYAHPFSIHTQLIEELSLSTTLSDEASQNITNRLSLSYEISDRIDWVNGWDLNIFIPADSSENDIVSNTFFSTFSYYLTNTLNADLTLRATDIEDDINNNGNDDTDASLFFGLTYRLK